MLLSKLKNCELGESLILIEIFWKPIIIYSSNQQKPATIDRIGIEFYKSIRYFWKQTNS